MKSLTTRNRTISGKTAKHVPQRTCVACRETRDQGELVRLVRTADKSVLIDAEGRTQGRGAYLCRRAECWQTAAGSGRLEHSLHASLDKEKRAELIEYGKNFS